MVSEQLDRKFKGEEGDVLILVLVEDGLREDFAEENDPDYNVLILVLVEDGLREAIEVIIYGRNDCLNPCSCGGWSQRKSWLLFRKPQMNVLILVLVEDGLRGHFG